MSCRIIDHETGEEIETREDASGAGRRAVRLMLERRHPIRVEGKGEARLYDPAWCPAPRGTPSWRLRCPRCGKWGRYPDCATCNACRLEQLPQITHRRKLPSQNTA